MPVTYGVFAIKGGTGKSTTFDMLATSLELPDVIDGSLKQIPPGGRKVCTLDLDSQGGTLHVTNNVPDAEVCLIDTPGALSPKLPIWVANVDVPIVVTRATSRDIEPLLKMQQIVAANAPGKHVVYVINGWNRYRACKDFRDWLESWLRAQGMLGTSTILTMPQSEMVVQAAAAGKSVLEYAPRSKIAMAALEVVNPIRVLGGFPEQVIV